GGSRGHHRRRPDRHGPAGRLPPLHGCGGRRRSAYSTPAVVGRLTRAPSRATIPSGEAPEMEETAPATATPRTASEYRAAIAAMIAELRRMNEHMDRNRIEIER